MHSDVFLKGLRKPWTRAELDASTSIGSRGKMRSHVWEKGPLLGRHLRWRYTGYAIYALLPFKVYLVANAKRKRELNVRFNLFESQDTPKLKPE